MNRHVLSRAGPAGFTYSASVLDRLHLRNVEGLEEAASQLESVRASTEECLRGAQEAIELLQAAVDDLHQKLIQQEELNKEVLARLSHLEATCPSVPDARPRFI